MQQSRPEARIGRVQRPAPWSVVFTLRVDPAEWCNPEDALNQRQFLDVRDICLENLPTNPARVFIMREVTELEADEICKELTINANNLWLSCTAPEWRCEDASIRTGSPGSAS